MQGPPVVLVIEDEANIVNLIEQSLMGMFVEVVATDTAEAGVAMAKQIQPDLILLDLALPGMSGWEALEEIRKDQAGSAIPVVVVTAHGDSATAVQARDAGAREFITKPFLPDALRRVVSQHLSADVAGTA